MKLNNKGFAFSTMLYGCVALIAAVLYIILNTNKTSVDTTYYYGEELLQELNDCVTEEIALENCYSSGSTTCNATAYHACLGVSDSNAQEKGVIISEVIKGLGIKAVDSLDDGLYKDPYVENSNRYIYVGNNVNNYIEYSGKKWRIVSIESDGSLMLIDPNKFTDTSWDTDMKSEWDSSTLFSLLNVNYLSTISDTSKLVQGTWYKSLVYPSLSAGSDYNLYDLTSQEKGQSFVPAKVGILSLSDYIKASKNTICKDNVLDDNTENCNSWLSQYKGWTININGEKTTDSEGYAYYFGDGKTYINGSTTPTNQYNKPFSAKTNEAHEVYPVILIDRNSVLKSGISTDGLGTESNPFVLK